MNKQTKWTINIVTLLSILVWVVDTQINVLSDLGLNEAGVKWVKLIGAVALVYLNSIKPTKEEDSQNRGGGNGSGGGVPPIGGGGGTIPPKP